MSVGAVSTPSVHVGTSGPDLLSTIQMIAQRQASRALAYRAAEAAQVAAQAAQLAAVQAIGAGRVDLYL